MAATAKVKLMTSLVEEVSGLSVTNVFNYSIPDLNLTLNGNSTPDVDIPYGALLALSGGSLTIDLTALTRTGRSALDLTGNVVHFCRIYNMGANDMTFVSAATNGYGLFTATNGTVVPAGGQEFFYSPAGYGTVGASAKDLTVTGTASQTFYFLIATGPAA